MNTVRRWRHFRLTPTQKFTFRIGHGFDHVFPVTGIEKKLTALCVGYEFNKIRIATNGMMKFIFVDTKHTSDERKRQRTIVLKFESV
jgi:hypothetical protein